MKRLVAFVFAVICFAACQKAPFLTMTGSRSYTFTSEGGSQTFAFSCNRDWSVSSSESWIRISPSSGSASDGDISVTITCSPNDTYDPRTATLTVKVEELVETISVTQGQTNGLFITTPDYNLSNESHTLSVEIKANIQFEVTSQADWIKYVETKALTPSTIVLNIDANESYDNRTGIVSVKQKNGNLSGTITINQKQMDGMFVSPTNFDLNNEAQTVELNVKNNVSFDSEFCSTLY